MDPEEQARNTLRAMSRKHQQDSAAVRENALADRISTSMASCVTPENQSPMGSPAEIAVVEETPWTPGTPSPVDQEEVLISPRGILKKHRQAPSEGAVKVVARFRPMNDEEEKVLLAEKQPPPFHVTHKMVLDRQRDRSYTQFDEVIDHTATQESVYAKTGKALVGHVMKGYNAGMFAYGQSGGGKTYSMLGKEGSMSGDLRGIVPRAIDELFKACSKMGGDVQHTCSISFMEVYKDNLYDLLLCDDKNDSPMRLEGRENRHMRTLTSVEVANEQQSARIVQLGQERRRYAWMPLNPVSSRSHGIIVFRVKRRYEDTSTSESSLYFVDLMGSEAMVESASGNTLDETAMVNMDLLTLGKVITALGDKKGLTVPPYRDSTLTWVLRDVLGGNCMATVLVTCSPHKLQYTATQNTLEFGDQCKGVQKVFTMAEKKLSTTELLCEVQRLQRQLFLAQMELEEASMREMELEIVAESSEAHAARADRAEEVVQTMGARLRNLENLFDDQVNLIDGLKEDNELKDLKEQRLERIRNDLTGYLSDSRKNRGFKIMMFVFGRLQTCELVQSICGWKVNMALAVEAGMNKEFMFQAVRSSELQEQNAALCVLRTMINCWTQTLVLSRLSNWRVAAAVSSKTGAVTQALTQALTQAANEVESLQEEMESATEELEDANKQIAQLHRARQASKELEDANKQITQRHQPSADQAQASAELERQVAETDGLKAQLQSMRAEVSQMGPQKVAELEGDLKASESERLETLGQLAALEKELEAAHQAPNPPANSNADSTSPTAMLGKVAELEKALEAANNQTGRKPAGSPPGVATSPSNADDAEVEGKNKDSDCNCVVM